MYEDDYTNNYSSDKSLFSAFHPDYLHFHWNALNEANYQHLIQTARTFLMHPQAFLAVEPIREHIGHLTVNGAIYACEIQSYLPNSRDTEPCLIFTSQSEALSPFQRGALPAGFKQVSPAYLNSNGEISMMSYREFQEITQQGFLEAQQDIYQNLIDGYPTLQPLSYAPQAKVFTYCITQPNGDDQAYFADATGARPVLPAYAEDAQNVYADAICETAQRIPDKLMKRCLPLLKTLGCANSCATFTAVDETNSKIQVIDTRQVAFYSYPQQQMAIMTLTKTFAQPRTAEQVLETLQGATRELQEDIARGITRKEVLTQPLEALKQQVNKLAIKEKTVPR